MSERDRYAVPKAALRDPEPGRPRRPATVWISIGILWLMLTVLTIAVFVAWSRMSQSYGSTRITVAALMGITSFIAALALFETGRGRNWGRIVTTLWTLAIIALGFGVQDYAKFPPWELVGALIPPGLLTIAAVLLFVPASNAWFRAVRSGIDGSEVPR